jgi:hypothetical protein
MSLDCIKVLEREERTLSKNWWSKPYWAVIQCGHRGRQLRFKASVHYFPVMLPWTSYLPSVSTSVKWRTIINNDFLLVVVKNKNKIYQKHLEQCLAQNNVFVTWQRWEALAHLSKVVIPSSKPIITFGWPLYCSHVSFWGLRPSLMYTN